MSYRQLLSISLKITGIIMLSFAINIFPYYLETIISWKEGFMTIVYLTIQLALFIASFWLLSFRTEKVLRLISEKNDSSSVTLDSSDFIKTSILVGGIIVVIISIWDVISTLSLHITFYQIRESFSLKELIFDLLGPILKLLLGYFLLTQSEKIKNQIEKL